MDLSRPVFQAALHLGVPCHPMPLLHRPMEAHTAKAANLAVRVVSLVDNMVANMVDNTVVRVANTVVRVASMVVRVANMAANMVVRTQWVQLCAQQVHNLHCIQHMHPQRMKLNCKIEEELNRRKSFINPVRLEQWSPDVTL